MSRLCLGTFLKTLIRCKIKLRNVTQKEMVGDVMHIIDPGFDETDDSMISNIVAGKKNPSNSVLVNVSGLEKEDCSIWAEEFKNICAYIDPNRHEECRYLLCYIIENDEDIQGDTIVELIGGVTKEHLREVDEPLESFLAGIFMYTLKYTDNKKSKKFVDEVMRIDKKHFMGDDNFKAVENVNKASRNHDDIILSDEDTLIEAQRFCMKYEDEIDLLPLCQIACDVNPLHRDAREMYNEYKLCKSKIRRKILELKGMPVLDFSDDDWVEDCLNLYDKEIHENGLTNIEFLYDRAKYFHRAYRDYSDYRIVEFDPLIFDRWHGDDDMHASLKNELGSLGDYIYDFCWCRENYSETCMEPPMDYLWNLCNLGGCPEPEITYWICKFIISSSYYMVKEGYPVDEKWNNVIISNSLIKTQEDMYYYALLQLYWLYMTERNADDLI